MIVYIDVLFLINFIMNYIVLAISSSFGGIYSSRIRWFIGAIIGATYAVLTFFHHFDFLNIFAIKILLAIIITLTAFGRKNIIKNTILILIVSSVLAGVFLGIVLIFPSNSYVMISGVPYIDIKVDILISVFLIVYVALSLMHKGLYKNKTQNICDIHIIFENKSKKIATFCDTGNSLCDILTGKPIIIVETETILDILPYDLKYLKDKDAFFEKPNNRRVRVINYSSIGNQAGLMLILKPDKILDNNRKEIKALIGLSYEKLTINGANALMGV